jgi:hypothetical protein
LRAGSTLPIASEIPTAWTFLPCFARRFFKTLTPQILQNANGSFRVLFVTRAWDLVF